MKRLLLIIGILLLFVTEILRVYFIMPFPGSQHRQTIGLAYFIDRYRIYLRVAGALMVAYPLLTSRWKTWSKVLLTGVAILYAVIFYFFNFRFEADKMFYQPRTKTFAGAADNNILLDRLVIGVVVNGEAKAYPIQIIGYHHQVRDTIGGTPVMITYCTVCRTGRVYSPVFNGEPQVFRLVGMDHFNAMFEDEKTKSWWQQATGYAIAGPLKGSHLSEIPSQQSELGEWLAQYPHTKVLQPDSAFIKQYDALSDYDQGTIKGSLEHRDSGSWKMKSWVVGVIADGHEKAYDWNALVSHRLIQDSLGIAPVILWAMPDSMDFRVFSRKLDGQTLNFELVGTDIKDANTGSTWNWEGYCNDGTLKGQQLQPVQSYQEFWHSWHNFHPQTAVF